MADLISVAEAQAWLERTKLTIGALDSDLLAQVQSQVLSRVSAGYDVSTWTTPAATPALIRSVIAMNYAAWFYDRQYSEDIVDTNNYAALLRSLAELNLEGVLAGTIDLIEVPTPATTGLAAFYPDDSSSSLDPSFDDPSLGPAKFSMGQRW